MIVDSKYLLALNKHPKIGGQTLKKIVASFDDLSEVWKVREGCLVEKLGSKTSSYVLEVRKFEPEKVIDKLIDSNIGYITLYDKKYPKLLKELPDSPVILYARGDLSILSKPCLGVVGSRKYSEYGKNYSYRFSSECSRAGLVIVSGLALGIDGFAHRAALDAGSLTVGVLGCGIDQIYPSSNFLLAKEMIERGSVIISEFPPGTPPLKFNFPTRNRIVAGLSRGVLVIEARAQSGALITAYQALDYNREVFSLPGNIDLEGSFGTNKLIQQGAKLVTCTQDILDEINVKLIAKTEKVRKNLPENPEEEIILNLLQRGEMMADDLVAESGLNVILLNSTLTIMEMKGMVSNLGGGRYKLIR